MWNVNINLYLSNGHLRNFPYERGFYKSWLFEILDDLIVHRTASNQLNRQFPGQETGHGGTIVLYLFFSIKQTVSRSGNRTGEFIVLYLLSCLTFLMKLYHNLLFKLKTYMQCSIIDLYKIEHKLKVFVFCQYWSIL